MVKLIHTRFFLIWLNLTIAFIPSRCNTVLQQTAKFMRFNPPTSKSIFLSSMLKMNKDHRSAGLRWSLILSGGSLGGHGSSLGFICSCFVFSITSPIIAYVAAAIFMKYLSYLMVNKKNQQSCVMMMEFHLLIQIIFDFGLSFPIFLLLTSLMYLLTSLLYLLCKTLANQALRSFSHGGLYWSLGEDNEQCTLLVVASN